MVASVRQEDTDYDDLLMSGVGREEARERIRPAIDQVLAAWSKGAAATSPRTTSSPAELDKDQMAATAALAAERSKRPGS